MRSKKFKLATGAVAAAVVVSCCPLAFAAGGQMGGQMGGGQMGGAQSSPAFSTQQSGGFGGGMQSGMGGGNGTFTQTSTAQASAAAGANSNAFQNNQQQSGMNSQQMGGQMMNNQMTQGAQQMQGQNGQQAQSQNGQQTQGQNGQQSEKGGMLEDMADDLSVTISASEKPEAIVTALKTAIEALDSDALAELAEEYDVDTTDLSDSEIVTAIEALLTPPAQNGQNTQNGQQAQGQNGQQSEKGGMLEDMADDLSVTISASEKPEAIVTALKTAIEALDSDALAELAEEYDVDTTDLSDSEIVTAIEALLTPPANLKASKSASASTT